MEGKQVKWKEVKEESEVKVKERNGRSKMEEKQEKWKIEEKQVKNKLNIIEENQVTKMSFEGARQGVLQLRYLHVIYIRSSK